MINMFHATFKTKNMRVETEYYRRLKIKKRQQTAFRRFVRGRATPINIRGWIGLNYLEVKELVEGRMHPTMNWQNYGTHWVIDHLVPFWLFDLEDEKQLKLLWHPENLLPMKWKHNNHKQGSLEKPMKLLISRKGYSFEREKLIEMLQKEDPWFDDYMKYGL